MFWKKTQEPQVQPLPYVTARSNQFGKSRDEVWSDVLNETFTTKPVSGATQDFFDISTQSGNFFGSSISPTNLQWFSSKSFPGYQALAVLAQHWLIDKACTIPCDDAVRKGWELTKNDGEEFDSLSEIRQLDKRFKVREKLASFAKMGRVYGIRVAVFLVDNPDKDYYATPFNIDSVKPGSYKGIISNDPYYIYPDVTTNTQNPNSPMFYEPEYWVIAGKRYHHSHCIVFRHAEVPQILKPSYIYGGISLTQQIYEAVYNAEISANEIPMLLQNMRMDVLKTDMSQVVMNPDLINRRMQVNADTRDNWGTRLIDINEDLNQVTTTLTGLDELVEGRYKLVASIAEMPVAKLLKTDLTGGLVKGGGEEAIYHETLESLQCKMLPFLEKHYQLLLKSELNYTGDIDIVFNKLDAMTEKEQAEVNLIKSQTASLDISTGAFDGQDWRTVKIQDKQSGYNGLDEQAPEIDMDDDI